MHACHHVFTLRRDKGISLAFAVCFVFPEVTLAFTLLPSVAHTEGTFALFEESLGEMFRMALFVWLLVQFTDDGARG